MPMGEEGARKGKIEPRALLIFFTLAVPFAAAITWASVALVPNGHVGVLTLFGKVTGEALPQGLHLVHPLKVNHLMSVRTQELKDRVQVPTADGLVVTVDISLIFHLPPEKAADVFRLIGPHYAEVVVEPTLRSAIRSITSAHSANALYSSGREEVARQIGEQLQVELARRGIVVESVLLRGVQMPSQ